ncbi:MULTISPECIES: glycosyltransferase family 2 protein [Nostocales]|uniref:Glycosyltransferase family 2 protein n=3 Tax=Nostocales TaxID=1161 RepID=A0A0C1QSV6_9CYAN|nr:glycosyltransferase family 2 protein [Tolypothrix bouteillei]KAF3889671.1 glycosyltransferase family 2 protein [Tolypothrix bouteillei VB521301]
MTQFSILIPSYNSENTIGETLESIQIQDSQLNKIYAIYLADDCSTDETIEVAIKTWKSQIPLLVLKGEKNLGERGNVNRALEVIKNSTEWVLILHSDDIAKHNWLETIALRIETCSEKVATICSSWDNLMPDGSVEVGEDNPNRQIEVIEGNDKSVKSTLLRGCWWHISGCAIRIKAFESLEGFNPKLPQLGDWEWLLRCLSNEWYVEYIPRTLILYRQHQTSVSSQSFQTNQDIKEFLKIVPNYAIFLNRNELIYIYLLRVNYVLKRALKSLITFKIKRLLSSLQVFVLLIKNSCLTAFSARCYQNGSKLSISTSISHSKSSH